MEACIRQLFWQGIRLSSRVWSLSRLARMSVGKKFNSSSRKTLAQLGSRKTNAVPASICGANIMQNFFEITACLLQKPKVIKRAATTDMLLWSVWRVPRTCEHLPRRLQHVRMVVIVPRIGPEQYLGRCRLIARDSALITARSEARKFSLRRDPQQSFYQRCHARNLKWQIREMRCHTWNRGRKMCPAVHEAEGIVAQMMTMLFMVVRQKLSLVRGDIHIYWAFASCMPCRRDTGRAPLAPVRCPNRDPAHCLRASPTEGARVHASNAAPRCVAI